MEITARDARITLPRASSSNRQLWIDVGRVVSGYGVSFRWFDGEGVLVLARHIGKGACGNFVLAVPSHEWLADLCDEEYIIDGVIQRNADGAIALVPYVRPARVKEGER